METETQLELTPLTPEKIRELIEKASPIENKYLLILEAHSRQGPAYVDFQKFEIIYGEADTIELNCWDAGYPYEEGCRYLIIPKTIPVVIKINRYDETQSPAINEQWLLIFTSEGWKEVRVR